MPLSLFVTVNEIACQQVICLSRDSIGVNAAKCEKTRGLERAVAKSKEEKEREKEKERERAVVTSGTLFR